MFDAIKLFYSCVGVIFVIYLLGYSTFLILSVLYGSLELYREKKKKKKYETVLGTFTYRNVPSEAFPLGIRLIQEGSRICGYNGAKHRTSAFFKMRYADLCSTRLICYILRR